MSYLDNSLTGTNGLDMTGNAYLSALNDFGGNSLGIDSVDSYQNPLSTFFNNANSDPTSFSFLQQAFGGKLGDGTSTTGYVSPLLNLVSSGLAGYLGLKQLGLAEDSLNFQKEAFNKQYAAQQTLTNNELRDRQAARVASNPTAYQDVNSYMAANAV